MNEGIIREGDTIEQIIDIVCEEYNVTANDFTVEVFEQAKKGFLGIGQRKAKFRIQFKMEAPGRSAEPSADTVEAAAKILKDILSLAQIEADVEGQLQKDKINLNIIGDGSGILIGKRGKTLDAFQYLMNKIISRQLGDNYSVTVDTENYRQKRKENLKEMAQKLSEKARRIGKPVSLRAMNAKERRIIHMALKEEKDVTTKSVGKGENKKLIIYPAEEKRSHARRSQKK